MGYCSDNNAVECQTVNDCDCHLFQRKLEHDNSTTATTANRHLQSCQDIAKAKDCNNAGCQWNGGAGCGSPPTSPPTSNPTPFPTTSSPTSLPTPSVSCCIIVCGSPIYM